MCVKRKKRPLNAMNASGGPVPSVSTWLGRRVQVVLVGGWQVEQSTRRKHHVQEGQPECQYARQTRCGDCSCRWRGLTALVQPCVEQPQQRNHVAGVDMMDCWKSCPPSGTSRGHNAA